ncbi:hypothetical protein DUNSADRAFT_10868 [Dunaliella salina]|uniref:Uncharacterized protein n=1 Tax=Dunaliella salina TaxID=3046 RepID=A0ABQ7HA10_DUNSA|nr:hypothetical protein DUNSADRAFT_10868 [Dunaliella salina]|eukprot:KAF5843692.1 hypothetical protein DUNSADRAFT_10868 [Dunaliella salina]
MQRSSRLALQSPPALPIDQNLQLELQQKTCNLVAVQRNYDVLSRVMQQKQSELDQLKKEHDEESRRALGLGIKLDDALSRAHRAGWSQLLFECLASTFQHPFP